MIESHYIHSHSIALYVNMLLVLCTLIDNPLHRIAERRYEILWVIGANWQPYSASLPLHSLKAPSKMPRFSFMHKCSSNFILFIQGMRTTRYLSVTRQALKSSSYPKLALLHTVRSIIKGQSSTSQLPTVKSNCMI